MGFITATPIGSSGVSGLYNGFQELWVSAPAPAGSTVLVCVVNTAADPNFEGGSGTPASISDTRFNTYTLLAQTTFGDGAVLSVYGSVLHTALNNGNGSNPLDSAQDIITVGFNAFVVSQLFAVSVDNCTLTTEFIETAGADQVTSGSPASYGAVLFGFTGYVGNETNQPSGMGAWDTPLIGQVFDFDLPAQVTPGVDAFIGAFGSEIFTKSAQTYGPDPSVNAGDGMGDTFATILIGLKPTQITGTMAVTERTDSMVNTSLTARSPYGFTGVTQADPVPPTAPGPWYFSYIADENVVFDPKVHNVMDEMIFSYEIKWAENQIPTLTMQILNPRVGLLNPDRKQWAILSYQPTNQQAIDNINNTYGTQYNLGDIIPLFKGILVGIPSDMFDEIITVVFNARSTSYIEQKQAVAEQLRNANNGGNYDAIFLDEAKSDDPDAILEGWSALYQVDRVTLDVSASDVLQGEGITVTFGEEMALYENLKFQMGECPLYNVQVQAQVKWTQRCIGYLNGPSAQVVSYTGGSFKSDWPKPGANLGGGWRCEFSYVTDVLDTEHAHTYSPSYHWEAAPNLGFQTSLASGGGGSASVTSPVPQHDCAPQSISYSATLTGWPGIMVPGSKGAQVQVGFCAPEGFTDNNGKPIQINIPAKLNAHGTTALLWILNCYWTVRYDAKRDYSELLIMDIVANLQSTLVSPTVDESTQLIKANGRDVGQPLVQPFAWSDFQGAFVPPGTLIYNNDPTTPGGRSYQVNINPAGGVAGTAIPVFSDVPGTQTVDGTVLWSSLGESLPNVVGEWTSATPISAGTIMVIEPKGFDVDTGDMQTIGTSCFALCIQGGTTNDSYTEFAYLPNLASNDDLPPLPIPFAVILGPGDAASTNVPGSPTQLVQLNALHNISSNQPIVVPTPTPPNINLKPGQVPPGINLTKNNPEIPGAVDTYGQVTSSGGTATANIQSGPDITPQGTIFGEQGNGGVSWLSLGTNPPLMPIVIGGTMTNVTANNYFSSDRGAQSIQYLINKARALIRWRARCVTVAWDAPFDYCVGISGIMNATVYDPRIPGGVATGKVKAYTLTCSEDGAMLGHIEVGVAVGYGNSVADISGVPEYTAATGYMEPGYQVYDGGQYALAEEDIAYTPISWGRYDDGLNLPLQSFPGTITFAQPSLQSAELALQMAQDDNPQLDGSIGFVLAPTSGQINPNNPITAWGYPGSSATTPFENTSVVSWLQGGQGTYLLESMPVSAEILIPPVDNGPFNGAFYVTCTELEVPKGVDLAAASSG